MRTYSQTSEYNCQNTNILFDNQEVPELQRQLPEFKIHQSKFNILVTDPYWYLVDRPQQALGHSLKLIQSDKTCSNMVKLDQTCSNLFKFVQTCPNLLKLVLKGIGPIVSALSSLLNSRKREDYSSQTRLCLLITQISNALWPNLAKLSIFYKLAIPGYWVNFQRIM